MGCALDNHAKWHALVDWCEDNSDVAEFSGVLFNFTRKGESVLVHVACDKKNIKNLRKGCAEFIHSIFSGLEWCQMIIATVSVNNPSVYNLCLKLGFENCGMYDFERGAANIMVIRR